MTHTFNSSKARNFYLSVITKHTKSFHCAVIPGQAAIIFSALYQSPPDTYHDGAKSCHDFHFSLFNNIIMSETNNAALH